MRPFEAGGEASLEFYCSRSHCSLFCLGSHSKKRPHNLVLGRMHDFRQEGLLGRMHDFRRGGLGWAGVYLSALCGHGAGALPSDLRPAAWDGASNTGRRAGLPPTPHPQLALLAPPPPPPPACAGPQG